MRMVFMFVVAALGVAVVAEGAYIVRTRSQMESLTERVASLTSERESGAMAPPRFMPSDDQGEPDDRGPRPTPTAGLPAPKLVLPRPGQVGAAPQPSGDPLPMPSGLDSPEAREQLRQFILAQLERERQEAQQRVDQRREDRERQRNEQIAKTLGLSASESERFQQITAASQQARQDLRARIQAGDVRGDAIRSEMQAVRSKSNDDMRALLGDDRMQKFEEIRRQDGGGPGGGRGFGFGRPGIIPGLPPGPGGPPVAN
jgi:hypothetical protein